VFSGFSLIDGIYNLDDPNYTSLTYKNFLNFKSKNFMCILENYDLEIANKKEEKDFKIFDKFFRVVNRKENKPKLISYSPKTKNLVTYSKIFFNRNSIVKQNAENFGRALMWPLRPLNKRRVQTTSQTTTALGTTNVIY